MMINAEERLKKFQKENHIVTKGPLSLVIQFTRMIRGKHFRLIQTIIRLAVRGRLPGSAAATLKKFYGNMVLRKYFHPRADVPVAEAWV